MSTTAFLPAAPLTSRTFTQAALPSRQPSPPATTLRRPQFASMVTKSHDNLSSRSPSSSSPAPAQADRLRHWRDVRARLVASESASEPASIGVPTLQASPPLGHESYVHPLGQLEVGACLIASTTHTWPKPIDYLRHAVVLITDVDASKGVAGLIMNRPTGCTVAQSPTVLARVGKQFADNNVNIGGDCPIGVLEVLHDNEDVAGADEVIPGLYRGGVSACRELVSSGRADADTFHFLISYTRWTWQQLAEEMSFGAWVTAAVSSDILLHSALEGPMQSPKKLWDAVTRRL
jgi:putative AlgH/UPF0301 family transcriptional regulator